MSLATATHRQPTVVPLNPTDHPFHRRGFAARLHVGLSDGDPVDTIEDIGIGGFDFTATTTARATYKAADALGPAYYRGNGTSTRMAEAAAANSKWMHLGRPMTVIALVRVPDLTRDAINPIFDSNGTSQTNVGVTLFHDNRASQSRKHILSTSVTRGVTLTGAAIVAADYAMMPGRWQVITSRFDYRGPTETTLPHLTMRVNGIDIAATASLTDAPSSADPTNPLTLFATGSGSLFGKVDISEIHWFDAELSDADLDSACRYILDTCGLPTLGRTVVQRRSYAAFPSLQTDPLRGNILRTTYTLGQQHIANTRTRRVSRVSPDGGWTWGPERIISTDASSNQGDGCATIIDGVYYSIQRPSVDSGTLTYAGALLESTDDEHWSLKATITPPYTGTVPVMASTSPMVKLGNGDWLWALYGKNDGASDMSVKVMRSQDDGATWAALATVIDTTTDYTESVMRLLDDGTTLLMYIRGNDNTNIYWSESLDNGATWSAPAVAVTNALGKPEWIQMASGAIALSYRTITASSQNNRIAMRYCSAANVAAGNYGTFGTEMFPDPQKGFSTYSGMAEREAGILDMIYGTELGVDNGDYAYSVIRFQRIREDVLSQF